jgi:hypothetical protein
MTGKTGQGIVRDEKGEEQPTDKERAQSAHKTKSEYAVSREATGKPGQQDGNKPKT